MLSRHAKRFIMIAAATISLAATGGLAFAGWLNNGAEIVMTMAQTGLAWCF